MILAIALALLLYQLEFRPQGLDQSLGTGALYVILGYCIARIVRIEPRKSPLTTSILGKQLRVQSNDLSAIMNLQAVSQLYSCKELLLLLYDMESADPHSHQRKQLIRQVESHLRLATDYLVRVGQDLDHSVSAAHLSMAPDLAVYGATLAQCINSALARIASLIDWATELREEDRRTYAIFSRLEENVFLAARSVDSLLSECFESDPKLDIQLAKSWIDTANECATKLVEGIKMRGSFPPPNLFVCVDDLRLAKRTLEVLDRNLTIDNRDSLH
jgi:hypothetical protein